MPSEPANHPLIVSEEVAAISLTDSHPASKAAARNSIPSLEAAVFIR